MKVKRKGTVRLLQLTEKLSDKERNELLVYIGELERSEDVMYQAFLAFARTLDVKVTEPETLR